MAMSPLRWLSRLLRRKTIQFHNGPLAGVERRWFMPPSGIVLACQPVDEKIMKITPYLQIRGGTLSETLGADRHYLCIAQFSFYWDADKLAEVENPLKGDKPAKGKKMPIDQKPKPREEKPKELKDPKEQKPVLETGGTGGFGKKKMQQRTPEEDAEMERRSKVVWPVEIQILRERGPEYFKRWKEKYYSFREDPAPWPEYEPMTDAELTMYLRENCFDHASKQG